MTATVSLLRMRDVVARTGLGKSTIHRLISLGEFPEAVPLLSRNSAYPSDLVDEWIHNRVKAGIAKRKAPLNNNNKKKMEQQL